MNLLELVVTERNRLVRYSILTSIVGVVLAIWARDEFLNITTPFSGSNEGNITAGHAVLIGHPIFCTLFLLLTAQIFRYKNLVTQLPIQQQNHLDWKFSVQNDDSRFMKITRSICEFFKWFAMVGVPVLASFILFFSQLDFEVTACGKKNSYGHIFSGDFFNIKPSYKKLHQREECESLSDDVNNYSRKECEKRNALRVTMLKRMPRLYQPLNFLGGLILQVFVVAASISTFRKYFEAD